ncbi:MAG TPA: alternative ribosome rescue aminoacyl-tRNA hydrolase ArfB [Pirellulales bacterium]
MLSVDPNIQIPSAEFEFSFVRSSGPGGQNVNKVNSKAVLRWNVAASPSLPPDVRFRLLKQLGSKLTGEGDVVITSQKYRDQPKNIEDCLEKVRAIVERAVAPPTIRKKTRPTKGSKMRRLNDKRRDSVKKESRRGGPMRED